MKLFETEEKTNYMISADDAVVRMAMWLLLLLLLLLSLLSFRI